MLIETEVEHNNSSSPEDRKLQGAPMKQMPKQFANPNSVTFESCEGNLHFSGVQDIDPKELAQKLKSICLIDVRQPDEFSGDLGHIPGAKLIVLDDLSDKLDQIPTNQTVVFVCRSGGRSARASSLAMQAGITDVYNLKGGMLLWNDLHLPTEI